MKEFIMAIIIMIIIFIVIGGILHVTHESEKKDIEKWASKKELVVSKIETHITVIGTPFYYCNDGSTIYEVDMTNKEKWWVRTSIFGNDYIKDDK